jgi:membrane-bound lytic murein transglycosylase B
MPQVRVAVLALALLLPRQDVADPSPPPFAEWLQGTMDEARARGFSDELITQTLSGLQPLPHVVQSDRTQAETILVFDRYFPTRVTRQTIRRGRELTREHRTLLARIQRTYGVPGRVVVAIWGMESRYGRNMGRTPVFQALATLAWEPRRSAFFRGQLFDAMTMVSSGYIDAPTMTGSWAGAMGQTQFMPSSYLMYAVDFDKDGRRDIWRSTPDALASIAHYLEGYGWTASQTWGREVKIPAAARSRVAAVPMRGEGCYAMRAMTERRPLTEWRRMGVRRADGGPLPQSTIPAGLARSGERAFLLYPNYDALLGYNCAHDYALSVAMLSERLR